MRRLPAMLAMLLSTVGWVALAARAGPDAAPPVEPTEPLELRVIAVEADGTVRVDRGGIDGLDTGDEVRFFPRDGAERLGSVVEVAERSARVQLRDAAPPPAPGVRGEARLPTARFEESGPLPEEPAAVPGAPAPDDAPGHPPWERDESGWSDDLPLLAEVGPVRPRQRPMRMTGRLYASGALTEDFGGDFASSFLRVGAAMTWDNVFERGGRLHVDAELDRLTKHNDNDSLDLLIKRASYRWGGDRFSDERWEVGRFQHHGVPEFGVLDGFEWTVRRDRGGRFGFSAGFLPRWDDDSGLADDLQFSGFYEWVSDPREQLVLTAGFQKTWHDGAPDRDLLVLKARSLPVEGWDLHGTVWIDFYTGSDANEDAFVEVTNAFLAAGRRWAGGHGLEASYRHLAWPELRRDEFLPVLDAQLADDRLDRLALDGWLQLNGRTRLDGHVSAWNDEDGTGGAAELGLELRGLFGPTSRVSLDAFGSAAQFENIFGARTGFARTTGRVRWDLLYELSHHTLLESDDAVDDLLQHRVRAGGSLSFEPRWDLSAFVEVFVFDEEYSWSLGFFLQKRF